MPPRLRQPLWLPTLALGWLLCTAVWCHAVDFKRVALADGFDFPVGKPNAVGYYKARGFTPNGHLGEDWNGRGGGDSDSGDPIYSVANGIVIASDNFYKGWGNCIIVRHAYRDSAGRIAMVDSQYAHLLNRQAEVGDIVKRGQQIATMGGNNGMYPVHLHFEMRKNLQIGMNRMQFGRDYSNYYSPSHFINGYRTCRVDLSKVDIPINNFAEYGKTLDSVDTKTYLRKGYSIPVYRAPNTAGSSKPSSSGGPTVVSSIPPAPATRAPERQTTSPSRPTTRIPAAPKPAEAMPETGGFWSRLRAKLGSKRSKTPEPPKR